jgi:SAM-dependent methyltransferase
MKGLLRLPAPLIELARIARTLSLRAVGPVERLFRKDRRNVRPPLWLRRHAGPVANFSRSAEDSMALIRRLALLDPGDLVLDVGCGAGAMAFELQPELGPGGGYVGFDVHAPSIAWCRKHFAGDPRFRFEIADVSTPFSPRSSGNARDVRLPAADGTCGLVLAKSLFTHLLVPEAASYLREIARVLRPGRSALVTAFLFDPNARVPAFAFADPASGVRWRVRERPHAAVAYPRPLFESLVSSAGLRIDRRIDGFFPGADEVPSGQDTLILSREPASPDGDQRV